MAWEDALAVVEKLAPMLATGLGSPLAGGAVLMLEGVFGIPQGPAASKDDRLAVLTAAISDGTPDQLLAMKKAEQEYVLQMAALGFKDIDALDSLSAAVRKNTRANQIASKSMTAPILAGLITLGFFGVMAAMMFYKLPTETHDAMMLMLGSLGTAWTGVVAYYFGSSAGSARKTELLSQQAGVVA